MGTVLLARRVAYEKGIVTGSICSPARARQILTQYDPAFGGDGSCYADPTVVRDLARADAVTQVRTSESYGSRSRLLSPVCCLLLMFGLGFGRVWQRLVCPGMAVGEDGEMRAAVEAQAKL